MLVVTASAAFIATVGFSASFTEPEAQKSACSIPNPGLFRFIYPKEKGGEEEGRRRRTELPFCDFFF